MSIKDKIIMYFLYYFKETGSMEKTFETINELSNKMIDIGNKIENDDEKGFFNLMYTLSREEVNKTLKKLISKGANSLAKEFKRVTELAIAEENEKTTDNN